MCLCHFSYSGLHELKQLAMACLLLVYCVELCATSCPYSGSGMRITLSDDSLESDGNYLACYEENGHFHLFFIPLTDWANDSPDPLPDFYFNTHSSNLNLYVSNDIELFFLPVTLSEYSEIVVRKIDSFSPDGFFLYFLWPVTTMSYEVVSGGYCEYYADSSEVLECFFEPEQEVFRLKTEVPLYMPAKAGKPEENLPGASGDGYPPSYLLILQSRLQNKEPPSEKKSFPMPGWFLSQSYRKPRAWLDDTLSDIGAWVSDCYKGEFARQNRFIEVYMYGQDGNQEDDEAPRSKPPQPSRQQEESRSDQGKTDSGPEKAEPDQRQKEKKDPRKPRTRFSDREKMLLNSAFRQSKYPMTGKIIWLAETLNISEETVYIWFRNRRAQLKKKARPQSLHTGASNVDMPLSPADSGVMFSGCLAAPNYQTPTWGEVGSPAQFMMPLPDYAAVQNELLFPQSYSYLNEPGVCPPDLSPFAQAFPQGMPAFSPEPASRPQPTSDDAATRSSTSEGTGNSSPADKGSDTRYTPPQTPGDTPGLENPSSPNDPQGSGQIEGENPRQKPPQPSSAEQKSTSGEKNTRTEFAPFQLKTLIETFKNNPYPQTEVKKALASSLGLKYSTVTYWFQNHRARRKKANSKQSHDMSVARMQSPPPPPCLGQMQTGGSVITQSYQGVGWGGADPSAQFLIPPEHYMPPQSAPQALNPAQYSGFDQGSGIYLPPLPHYPHLLLPYDQVLPAPSLEPISSQDGATATGGATEGGDVPPTSSGLSSHPAPSPASENPPTPDLSSGNQEEK